MEVLHVPNAEYGFLGPQAYARATPAPRLTLSLG
eukprot:gene11536-biopygen4127